MSQIRRKRTTSQNQPLLKRFTDKVVVITGGSSGIGQACALRLVSEGASICIVDMIDGQDTLNQIKEQFGYYIYAKCSYYKLNVTDYSSVQNIINKIITKYDYIDGLIQCAGITGTTGIKAHEADPNDFEKVWRVNVLGIFNLCKAVIPYMLKENYGRIINVASISGKEGNPGQISYAASKGAVIALTKTMGKDYAKTGITVNSIAPAVIKTGMVQKMPQSQVDMMTSKIPMGRCGELNEIASLICYMASEENSFSTGFCFDMTGGRATY